MSRKKFKIGLVIGRFQPFHKGHEFLFERALELCDSIVVGIGSANKNSQKNPWKASSRRKMLQEFIKAKGYEDRIIRIVNLYDNSDDDVWFRNLYKKIGHFDVTIGNNDWNNGIIERHGIPAVKVGFENREEWEGIQIRQLMKEKKPWEDRVPTYIRAVIK
ncbi:MAG: adenylyltransferase/cytidyltransferase family protein [Candidatus Levybacteria bacterium]|nr:adenylyltransferase/cytidyltransferase family protein [Candidatus Levybacteria bacterium]